MTNKVTKNKEYKRFELETTIEAKYDLCKMCYKPWINGCRLEEVNRECRYSVLSKLSE